MGASLFASGLDCAVPTTSPWRFTVHIKLEDHSIVEGEKEGGGGRFIVYKFSLPTTQPIH